MIPDEGAALGGGTAPIWQDMLFLHELRDELGRPSMPERDGMDAFNLGYKPRPPGDPRWLVWLTWVMFAFAVISFVGIMWWNMRS